MREREINEGRNGTIMVPESIAIWDGPSSWERERLGSMEDHLEHGMALVDVGTEHGWLTAVYGQFVGMENVVLCEPGSDMWQDIRSTWEANYFRRPLGIWPGFVGATPFHPSGGEPFILPLWPAWTVPYLGEGTPESPVMSYKSLSNENAADIAVITIDEIDAQLWQMERRHIDAITIDVEGAELEVMKGAQGVLGLQRPLVWISEHADLIERDFGSSLDELHALMAGHGYRRQFIAYDHEAHAFYAPREYR